MTAPGLERSTVTVIGVSVGVARRAVAKNAAAKAKAWARDQREEQGEFMTWFGGLSRKHAAAGGSVATKLPISPLSGELGRLEGRPYRGLRIFSRRCVQRSLDSALRTAMP